MSRKEIMRREGTVRERTNIHRVKVSRRRPDTRIHLGPRLGCQIQRPHLTRQAARLNVFTAKSEYGGRVRRWERGKGQCRALFLSLPLSDFPLLHSSTMFPHLSRRWNSEDRRTVNGGGTSPLVPSVQLIRCANDGSILLICCE